MTSNPLQTVQVQLGLRSYAIEIGTGLLDELGPRLVALRASSQAVVITDENVQPHATRVAESLSEQGIDVTLLTVSAGETTKSLAVADRLWQELLAAGADRQTVVVAVGGGVVGDLAGFVAACYARGVDLVQVPTTLLAQVDSSVGGKTGVNLPQAKNMVGAFWQPRYVLIDTDVLASLPDREYRAGLAEVVKYGMILDAAFFEFLESSVEQLRARHAATLCQVIARCCQLKAQVVEADERELTGLRAVLNYGHTFAHALEAETGYGQLLHGEAVAIGMLCASRLAESLGRIDAEITRRQQQLLAALQLPTEMPEVSREALLAAMQRDKKVAHGQLRFVLPSRIGHVELVGDVDPAAVRAALQ